MSITLDVMDLVNYPGTTKRVTIDSEVLVPLNQGGDEKYMLSASTASYSDAVDRTAIADLYVSNGKLGWSKSSGFKGINGKFALDTGVSVLGVKIDATVSGTAGGFYQVTLDHDNGVGKKGEDIATDLQAKLRDVVCNAGDVGFQLAYKSCSVVFKDNKFYIASGTIGDTFTGPYRSSVLVGGSPASDCAALLGFDQQVTTEALSSIYTLEAALSSDYTAAGTTLNVSLLTGITAGDALCITDGTNTDYFIAEAYNDAGAITVAADSISGIANSYTTAAGSYIQVLKKGDPDNLPDSYHKDTDELLRYMAKIMINQIDFSG